MTNWIRIFTFVAISLCSDAWYCQKNIDIDDLLNSLTIEEKVGQMTQINLDVICEGSIYNLVEPHHIEPSKLRTAIEQWHVGSILNCGGHAYTADHWEKIITPIHKTVDEVAQNTGRPKLPILYGIDAIHGANYILGSVLFPQPLAQAATFDVAQVKRCAEITAVETRAAGIPWNFSPVLDVGRNPLWSRFFETYGEDTYLCAQMGSACIEGYQGKYNSDGLIDKTHVAACMKHFLGYSAARTGKDRTPAIISDIELREIYLPSFQSAIASGAMSVMINSGEINGIPVHANPVILTQLLRKELQFEGVAVTDWEDVSKLHQIHRVSSDMKNSVLLAVQAGIDLCMVPNDFEFARYLLELVREGKISMDRINESVRRLLTMKKKLGLFDDAILKYKTNFQQVGCQEHRQAALETARKCITLLKNDAHTLPIKGNEKILITGPAANSTVLLNGAWSRTWQGVDTTYEDQQQNTILTAFQKVGRDNVSHYPIHSTTASFTPTMLLTNELERCNVVIICLGENPSTEKPGDIDALTISQGQIDLVKYCSNKGKKIILVLIENRPQIIHDIVPLCDAVLMAYQPGTMGADAIYDVLTGKVSPSGRLPFTYPAHEHTLLTYDHKYSEALDTKFGFEAYKPEWPFGYGLGYSPIAYGKMKTNAANFSGNAITKIVIPLTNEGRQEQEEVVLLYTRDHVASVTPSVRKLKAFQRISLKPGETKEVIFQLTKKDFEFVGTNGAWVFEAGTFDLIIGDQKEEIQWID